jgi:hypothetical protein
MFSHHGTWTAAFPLGACFAVAASAAHFTTGVETAQKFGVHEVALTCRAGSDPLGTVCKVTFTSPSGREYAVEAFYDGGETWKARCYVAEPGGWRWTSSCEADSGLDGMHGSFRAEPSSLPGRLKPHPDNPRLLATDGGSWFSCIGDTGYFLFGAKDLNGRAVPPATFQKYVRDDWEHGVNMIRANYNGGLRSYHGYFEGSNPNLATLQLQDSKLAWMLNHYPGMYVQFIIYPERAADGYALFPPEAHSRLLRQMLARWGAFPSLTWMVMNDTPQPKAGKNTEIAGGVFRFLAANEAWPQIFTTGGPRGTGAPLPDLVRFLHFETLDSLDADEADAAEAHRRFAWCGEDRYETYKQPGHPRYFFRRLMWAWLLSNGSACYGGDWRAVRPYTETDLVGLDGVKYINPYFSHRKIDMGAFRPADELAAVAGGGSTASRDRVQVARRGNAEFLCYHPNSAGSGAAVHASVARAQFTLNLSDVDGLFSVEWFRCQDGVSAPGGNVAGRAEVTLSAPWEGHDVVCRLWTGAVTGPHR